MNLSCATITQSFNPDSNLQLFLQNFQALADNNYNN